MRNKTYEREKRENMLTAMVEQRVRVMEYIARNYEYNATRMEVLERILCKVGCTGEQQLKDDIYLYGSMIRQQDLAARQMFLWLIALAEEMEQA